MDILSIAGTVFRHWYFTVPIVLAAFIIAFFVEREVPPEFEANGSVLLANPELDPARLPLTAQRMDSLVNDVQGALDAGQLAEPGTETVVTRVDGTTLAVDVAAPDEASAFVTTDAVVADIAARLASVQEENNIPAAERTEVLPGATEIVASPEGDDDAGTDEVRGQLGLAGEVGPDAVLLSARILLSDPTAGINNPFGATSQTSRVLEVALHSDAGRAAMEQTVGREVDFTVSQNDRDAAPIVTITTLAAEEELALEDFDHVVSALSVELDARQERAQVPESRRVTLENIAPPQEVEDVSPPLSRVTAAIIALGGLLALGVAIAVESATSRRQGNAGPPAVPEEESKEGPFWGDSSDIEPARTV